MSELYRIGFNQEDRFMTAVGDTLVVLTRTGAAFGAQVVGQQMKPVFRFTGPPIGFNPEDRFVLATGRTLVVVTERGDVFGADVDLSSRTIGPVVRIGGDPIGYNADDRFMVALGRTLMVVTRQGAVWGADLVEADGRKFLSKVARFPGAAIGSGPRDRFMTGLRNTLIAVTHDGDVYAAGLKSTPTAAHLGIGRNGRPYGRVYEREVLPVARYAGATIGSSDADRFMMALDRQLVVVRGDGDVFGAFTRNATVEPLVRLNVPEPKLKVSTATNAIRVELELGGESFTPGGTCSVRVENVPEWPPIEHSHFSVDAQGEWYWPQSFEYRTVGRDVELPPIRVSATDETTGRTVTGSTSAEPYVVRFP